MCTVKTCKLILSLTSPSAQKQFPFLMEINQSALCAKYKKNFLQGRFKEQARKMRLPGNLWQFGPRNGGTKVTEILLTISEKHILQDLRKALLE